MLTNNKLDNDEIMALNLSPQLSVSKGLYSCTYNPFKLLKIHVVQNHYAFQCLKNSYLVGPHVL